MSWRNPFDKECPTNSRDAYYEGRNSPSWDRNPYEHGRDPWADRDCREANEEWNRGHRAAEYEREQRAEEERIERQRAERRAYEAQQEECYYPEPYYPEPEYPPEPEPEPPGHNSV